MTDIVIACSNEHLSKKRIKSMVNNIHSIKPKIKWVFLNLVYQQIPLFKVKYKLEYSVNSLRLRKVDSILGASFQIEIVMSDDLKTKLSDSENNKVFMENQWKPFLSDLNTLLETKFDMLISGKYYAFIRLKK